MDFGPWGDGTVRMDQNQQPESVGGGSHPEVPEGGNFTHNFEHTGVQCDVCNTVVRGFRYKCMQCSDYDLCAQCERRGLHAGHVMMRIAFPEQAWDAIKNYMPEPSPRHRGHFPHHFSGFHGRHHGRGKRHEKRAVSSSDDEEAAAGTATATANATEAGACPYVMSKKELKRLSKCMKKASHHSRRGEGRGQGRDDGNQTQYDYTPVINQIQEYLNAFGIPIDVVTLYDEWGNATTAGRGDGTGVAQGAGGEAGATTSEKSTQEHTSSAGTTIPINVEGAQTMAGSGNLETGMVNQFQDLHINPNDIGFGQLEGLTRVESVSALQDQNNAAANRNSVSVPVADTEGDWTMLDDDKTAESTRDQTATSENGNGNEPPTAPPLIDISSGNTTPADSLGGNAIPLPPPPQRNGATTDAPKPTAPPRAPPAGTPLYPQIPVQLQQVMSGVANTVGSALRNIPTQVPRPPTAPPTPQLDTRMTMTLNQLLSMGFSNHDGWLARLVVSKQGDLDAVLNALFPAETR